MKTWQAALAHIGTSALQTAGGIAFFDQKDPKSTWANPALQIALQVALGAFQVYISKLNSDSDPNGNKLVKTSIPNQFITEPAK